jgi:CubicO group peptidase (beta-lactamase class C family)
VTGEDPLDETGPTARALSRVSTLFGDRMQEGRAPSSSWGVFDRDGVIASGVTGQLGDTTGVAGSVPPRDAIYRIASCTKSFTATALLALRDEGAITLDQPVTDFVPAFRAVALPTPDSPVPTVRMLLTMSGGLPTDDPWGDRQESITDADLDALLRRGLRFDSIPGTRFAYSNLGYALLGRVVEVASGRPYRDVVTDRILRPLQLASTTFETPRDADDRLAVGHRRLDDEWQPLPFSGPGAFSPIGGLFSTVDDLSRWARWLASAFDPEGGVEGDGATADLGGILSRASRREMQQAYRSIPTAPVPTGYGFGLMVEEHPGIGTMVSHSGGYPGFSAHMRWHVASGYGIVAFENATYAQVSVPATTAIHGLVRELALTPPPRVWPEVRVAQALVQAAVVDGAELPGGLLSENVDWDVPIASRRSAWREAMETVGLDPALSPVPQAASTIVDGDAGEESQAPSHLVWHLTGTRGRLRLELRMTPELPPRVQTITVGATRLT